MQRSVYSAFRLEYSGQPTVIISVDGSLISTIALPFHSTFRGRRMTLPASVSGYISHMETASAINLQNENFEAVPIESFAQQQLFHYAEYGFRGNGNLVPKIFLDGSAQTQTYTITTQQNVDVARIYFNPLAYGYIPHIYNNGTSTDDAELLWTRFVALPPRFYRGIRTHAEFQITYKGDVNLEWFLDGTSIGTYDFSTTNTVTEKAYFPSGTIGHVLQYTHVNPEDGGKVYIVETDVTLGDLEQQAMRPQAEEG